MGGPNDANGQPVRRHGALRYRVARVDGPVAHIDVGNGGDLIPVAHAHVDDPEFQAEVARLQERDTANPGALRNGPGMENARRFNEEPAAAPPTVSAPAPVVRAPPPPPPHGGRGAPEVFQSEMDITPEDVARYASPLPVPTPTAAIEERARIQQNDYAPPTGNFVGGGPPQPAGYGGGRFATQEGDLTRANGVPPPVAPEPVPPGTPSPMPLPRDAAMQAGGAMAAQGIVDSLGAPVAPMGGGVVGRTDTTTQTEHGIPMPGADAQFAAQAQAMRGEGAAVQQGAGEVAQEHRQAASALDQQQGQTNQNEQRRQAAARDALARSQAAVDRATGGTVDPDRMLGHGVTASRVTAAIAVGLGAIGAALANTPNFALQIITNAIDKDIEAQKANLANRAGGAEMQRGLYRDMLAEFGDERQAEAATRAAMLQAAEMKIRAAAATAGGAQAAAHGEVMATGIELEAQKFKNELARIEADHVTTSEHERTWAGGGGGASRAAAIAAAAQLPDASPSMRWYADRRMAAESGLGQLQEATRMLADIPRGEDIPGVGPVLNAMSPGARNAFVGIWNGPGGLRLRTAIEGAVDQYIYTVSGKQSSDTERAHYIQEFGLGPGQSQEQVRIGVDRLRQALIQRRAALASADPGDAAAYEGQYARRAPSHEQEPQGFVPPTLDNVR